MRAPHLRGNDSQYMQIIDITDKQQLNDFVGSQTRSQFLQSWQWGEFQAKVSGRVWRIGVLDNNELVASAKIITKDLPMGKKYLYCGRGPIIASRIDKKAAAKLLFNKIKELSEQVGAMFLRFDPVFPLTDFKRSITKTIDVQPSQTIILDLSLSEAEILKNMHQKTRYNIRLAEKRGVKIVEADASRFEEFWQLLTSTGDRDEFNLHGRSYYKNMLQLDRDFMKLFFAEFKGKPIATALVSFFGDTATYLHGGSANEDRNVMAPYLLQWHGVKLAKTNGQKYYDFHGIDEVKWPGVTRFKNGFGGAEVNYPGTFDLVYDQGWYSIYKMIRKIRRTF